MSTPDDYEFYLDDPMPEGEFYQWVGRCIKEWAKIEDMLFEICRRILRTELKRAAIVYYRTPTIDARLSLTDELVLSVLPQRARQSGGHDHPNVTEWRQIVKDIRELLPIRNILAHSRVGRPTSRASFAVDDDQPGEVQTSWFEIATNFEEQLRGRPELCIIDRHLPDHLADIKSTFSNLDKFFSVLKKKRYVKRALRGEPSAYSLPHRPYQKPSLTRSRQATPKRPPGSSRG
jgi:hypothetical protein